MNGLLHTHILSSQLPALQRQVTRYLIHIQQDDSLYHRAMHAHGCTGVALQLNYIILKHSCYVNAIRNNYMQ